MPKKQPKKKRATPLLIEGTCVEVGREAPRPRGRPCLYTEEVVEEILQRLAEGETLSQICRDDHLPARPTVISWVNQDLHGFADRYRRARDLMLESWADQVIEIAENSANDWMQKETKSGRVVLALNHEAIARSQLRIASRQWLLARMKPERYGAKPEAAQRDSEPAQQIGPASPGDDHLAGLRQRYETHLKVINGGAPQGAR